MLVVFLSMSFSEFGNLALFLPKLSCWQVLRDFVVEIAAFTKQLCDVCVPSDDSVFILSEPDALAFWLQVTPAFFSYA